MARGPDTRRGAAAAFALSATIVAGHIGHIGHTGPMGRSGGSGAGAARAGLRPLAGATGGDP
jgi:hypothetical protein